MPDRTLNQILTAIGLDDKEARVYLALLELGSGTATQIAERAEVTRTIVYHVIERLKEKGYASEIEHKKIRRFQPSDPKKIFNNVRNAFTDFKEMLPFLKALQDKGRDKPRIEFFEGKEAIVTQYREFDVGTDMRFLSSTKRLNEFIPTEVAAWITRFEHRKMNTVGRHLLTDTVDDRTWGKLVVKTGQEVRLLPKNTLIDMDFAIVDDKLGITSFDPLFIIVIHSEKIARSAAVLFDLAWLQAARLK